MSEYTSLSPQPQTAPAAESKEVVSKELLKQDIYLDGLQRLPIQRKLTIGEVDDPLEHEADAVAEKVMRMPEQSFVQRKTEEDEQIHLKRNAITSFIQRKCAECEQEEKEINRKPLSQTITP